MKELDKKIEDMSEEEIERAKDLIKNLEDLVDRWISIRRKFLGTPDKSMSLEKMSVDKHSEYIIVTYSHDSGCICSARDCGYDYDTYEIYISELFFTEEDLSAIFQAEADRRAEVKRLREEKELQLRKEKEQAAEEAEKELFNKLKEKYGQ